MATTLTGYSVGTSGVNWFVSADMKTKLGEMSTALTQAVPGTTALTFGGGYISRYELIRQLVTKIGYQPDETLRGKVMNQLQNKDVTTSEWSTVENWLNNQDVQQSLYKYVNHPYIQNNQNGSYIVDSPAKPQDDLFRSGNVVRIKTGANGAMSLGAWNVSTWMLQNSHKYGFFFIGPADDTFLFDATKTLNQNIVSELQVGDPIRYWVKVPATNGLFNNVSGQNNLDQGILSGLANGGNLTKYDEFLKSIANKTGESGRVGAMANAAARPWLILAEKIY